ncbi:MAG: class I SAM-dependent methyltransferase [Rhizobiaceae bacterium]
MNDANPTAAEDWREHAFDLTRGIAAYCGSNLVANLARVIAKHPEADIANAFNHKQVACKMWAVDALFDAFGPKFERIWVLGGWYGVLAAMLFDDMRFDIGVVENIDIDPSVEAVGYTLNRSAGERFKAITQDMYKLDYAQGAPDLVVNTSCEHIADVRGWLDMLPNGTRVLLQSNDYFAEPTHINCVASLDQFRALAQLAEVRFAGALPQKKYTRFMLIGSV